MSSTSVLVFPLCRKSFWNIDNFIVLNSYTGHLLQYKSLLSLSLHFHLLHFVSSPSPPVLPLVILDEISQPGEQSKSTPEILPHSSYPLSKIQVVVQKELLFGYRDIPNQPSYHHTAHCHPCMVTHWQPRKYFGLRGPIFDTEINIFSTTFTWEL